MGQFDEEAARRSAQAAVGGGCRVGRHQIADVDLRAAFLPRLMHVPEPELPELSLSTIATILALFMQGVIWTNIIISYYLQRAVQLHVTDGSSVTTFKALGVVARLFIWIALGLTALSALHIQIKPLLTGLGIGGLAIALAVQNILGDLFAGLSIIFSQPFRLGDYISITKEEGVVLDITLFTTTLGHTDRSMVVIPNRKIVGEILHNYGRIRQLNVAVSVAYGTDVDTALGAVDGASPGRPFCGTGVRRSSVVLTAPPPCDGWRAGHRSRRPR